MGSDADSAVPKPDYSLSLLEIYCRLLEDMSAARGDLDWLMLANGPEPDQSWPSWCPNLVQRAPAVSMNTSRSLFEGGSHGFLAAGTTKPVIRITRGLPATWLTRAYVIDEIVDIPAEPDYLKVRKGPESGSHDLGAGPYQSKGANFEAIWKTVVADQDFEGTGDAWQAPDIFRAVFLKLACQTGAQMEQTDLHRE
jgi:hypothetical protein